MADARLTIRFRFDFTDAIRQLRQAADELEALQGEGDDQGVADQLADPNIVRDTRGG
ncbi:hypothetical protein [Streptomyces gilvus]|uniref:hypothetical protein n=1 Tax=Streptomyces gilvus TaxID=2920937 RepID=UPI001F1138BC|nr:hypothetical protein [Streptomyces sp. CME 23]MCH5677841.1 hypothetical protein [Streptomyces sp. CME 23]